jgi:hypothetical protein
MFEFLCEILAPLAGFFFDIYHADTRLEAQQATIGCGLFVLILFSLFILWMLVR